MENQTSKHKAFKQLVCHSQCNATVQKLLTILQQSNNLATNHSTWQAKFYSTQMNVLQVIQHTIQMQVQERHF